MHMTTPAVAGLPAARFAPALRLAVALLLLAIGHGIGHGTAAHTTAASTYSSAAASAAGLSLRVGASSGTIPKCGNMSGMYSDVDVVQEGDVITSTPRPGSRYAHFGKGVGNNSGEHATFTFEATGTQASLRSTLPRCMTIAWPRPEPAVPRSISLHVRSRQLAPAA